MALYEFLRASKEALENMDTLYTGIHHNTIKHTKLKQNKPQQTFVQMIYYMALWYTRNARQFIFAVRSFNSGRTASYIIHNHNHIYDIC